MLQCLIVFVLIVGEQVEDVVCCCLFMFVFVFVFVCVVGECVVGVDFDDVVQKDYLYDVVYVDCFGCVFCEYVCYESEMLGVFCVVFVLVFVSQEGLLEYVFEVVDFDEEFELLCEMG